jgi:hypothetical protein
MKRTMLVVLAAMIASLFPTSSAWAAPAIQLLNPSNYTATPELSSKVDVDGAFHFVAWVPNVPPSPIVEFEIQPTAGNTTTIEASRVGTTDTFEAFHPLTGLADGTYTVRAILFSGTTQFGEDDEETVAIRNGMLGQSETAEITHPANGGQLGFFTPKDALPRAIVDVRTSADAEQVRVLYTISPPGSEPVWTQCGTASVNAGLATVRCTLADKTAPSAVSAIAALANQTPPPGPPQPAADDAGDAHRVTTYAAVPSRVTITPEAEKVEVAKCKELTVQVFDQQSRPLQLVNVDVHAVGPTDQLQFATGGNEDDFQAPNAGPHSKENTRLCNDLAGENQQGDTNRVNAPDEKHIETVLTGSNAGTDNQGSFTFALYSGVVGGTAITAWADANDDDVQSASEASGGARLGFGQDPPPPVRQLFLDPANSSGPVGSCQGITVVAKEGGNTLPFGNIDVHILGPDSSVTFCTPSGGSPTRTPDSGEHVSGVHSDGTKHIEGEVNSAGQFVFGVVSPSAGETTITAWLDETDDDTLSAEPSVNGTASFGVSGDRSISLDASRRRVPQGRRVRLFGAISGSEACEGGQTVKLKSRAPGGRFRTIGSRTTSGSGEYAFRVRVRRTKDYRAVAPRNGVCELAKSSTVRVRAT